MGSLQAKAIYRLEIGASFFAVSYLVTMAMFLALDGRGFAEIGTKGRLDEHETRLEKLEARLID